MKTNMFLTIVSCLVMVCGVKVSAQVAREYSGIFSELEGDGIYYLPQPNDEIKIEQLPGYTGGKFTSISFYKPSIRVGITARVNPLPKDKDYVMPVKKGKIKDVNTKNLHFRAFDKVKVTFLENENRMMNIEVIRGGKPQGKMRVKW